MLSEMAPEIVIFVAAVVAALGLPPLGLKLCSRANQNIIEGSVAVLKKWVISVWNEKLYSNLTSPCHLSA